MKNTWDISFDLNSFSQLTHFVSSGGGRGFAVRNRSIKKTHCCVEFPGNVIHSFQFIQGIPVQTHLNPHPFEAQYLSHWWKIRRKPLSYSNLSEFLLTLFLPISFCKKKKNNNNYRYDRTICVFVKAFELFWRNTQLTAWLLFSLCSDVR